VVDHVVGHGVVPVLEVGQLGALLRTLWPGAHQLAQEGGGQLDVASGLAEHAVELAVVGLTANQLCEALDGAAARQRDRTRADEIGAGHAPILGCKGPALVTFR
jgi:adenine deaminase